MFILTLTKVVVYHSITIVSVEAAHTDTAEHLLLIY